MPPLRLHSCVYHVIFKNCCNQNQVLNLLLIAIIKYDTWKQGARRHTWQPRGNNSDSSIDRSLDLEALPTSKYQHAICYLHTLQVFVPALSSLSISPSPSPALLITCTHMNEHDVSLVTKLYSVLPNQRCSPQVARGLIERRPFQPIWLHLHETSKPVWFSKRDFQGIDHLYSFLDHQHLRSVAAAETRKSVNDLKMW